jgi:Rieske Fe-S protein
MTTSPRGHSPITRLSVSRRTVLAGAAAAGATAALAACGSDDPGQSTGTGDGAPVTLATSEVPVGGGTIKSNVVVTQPSAGEFKAFSAVCTHQGCLVASVQDSKINCFCHNSSFSAVDGSVVGGPATKPLVGRTVTVDGDNLTVS